MSAIFFNKNNAENILQQLWQQCENEELCDVVLIAGDEERRIPAHRAVLVAASEYFKGMFTSSMRESMSKVVKLSGVNGDISRSLIKYCYTGSVVIREDNVVELLRTADMLLLSNVVTACGNFLVELLDPSNCLGYLHFAEQYHCQMFLQKVKDYCLEHFMEVFETDEFLNLSAQQLGDLLECDDLHVAAEEQVFTMVMTWLAHDHIEREHHKDELLKLVRLQLLERSFLVEHVRPVCTSDESHRIYTEALEWHSLLDGKIINSSRSTKLRRSAQFLFAVTVVPGTCGIRNMQINYYCPQQLKWMEWNKNLKNLLDFAVVAMEDNFYFIGGNSALNAIDCLNLSTMTVSQISPMTKRREGCGAAVLKGFLFAVGGWNGSNCNSSVERWNSKTNTWSEVASMSVSRSNFGITCLGEQLYVVGGMSDRTRLNSVEYYDLDENVWKTVAAMHKCRSYPGVAVSKGLLYVMGGEGNKTVERYDSSSNTWTMICSLRDNFLEIPMCITFCDKVVAYCKDHFEEYNNRTNEWEVKSSLNGLGGKNLIIKYLLPYSGKILISAFASSRFHNQNDKFT